MKILALDSSSPVASVAFLSINSGTPEILFEQNTAHARSDSSALFTGLESAVKVGGKPDALCVGLGPGSYNGLRASIAAAKGFATALSLPLHAIPSPLAIAGPNSGFWTIGDARGGHYWVARVAGEAFAEDPRLLSPKDAIAHVSSRSLPVYSITPLVGFDEIMIATPSAARLAMLAQKNNPSCLASSTPEPLYLKPPHITAPKVLTPTR
jgi:tRNA threonylcarbamoyl adenosine modification protein YeaZ